MNFPLTFFLSGLALGASICGIHCSILLVPLVAREDRNWREGVRTGLLFGGGKVLVYATLGGLAAYSGYLAQSVIDRGILARAGGVTLMLMAAWFFWRPTRCGKLFRTGSPFLLGLVDGVFPCGPMLGFVLYLAYAGPGLAYGIMAGALFALGSVTGPVLVVCGATPHLWRRLAGRRRAATALRVAGSAIFILWGLNLFLS